LSQLYITDVIAHLPFGQTGRNEEILATSKITHVLCGKGMNLQLCLLTLCHFATQWRNLYHYYHCAKGKDPSGM